MKRKFFFIGFACFFLILLACNDDKTTPEIQSETSHVLNDSVSSTFEIIPDESEISSPIERAAPGVYRITGLDSQNLEYISLSDFDRYSTANANMNQEGTMFILDSNSAVVYNCLTDESFFSERGYKLNNFLSDSVASIYENWYQYIEDETLSYLIDINGERAPTDFVMQIEEKVNQSSQHEVLLSFYDILHDKESGYYYAVFSANSSFHYDGDDPLSGHAMLVAQYDEDLQLITYIQSDWGLEVPLYRGSPASYYILAMGDGGVYTSSFYEFDFSSMTCQKTVLEQFANRDSITLRYKAVSNSNRILKSIESELYVFYYQNGKLICEPLLDRSVSQDGITVSTEQGDIILDTRLPRASKYTWTSDDSVLLIGACEEYTWVLPDELQPLLGAESYTRGLFRVMTDGSIRFISPIPDGVICFGEDYLGRLYYVSESDSSLVG